MKKQQKNSHVLEPYARQVHVSAVEAGRTCSLRYTGADNVMFHCMVTDAADAGMEAKKLTTDVRPVFPEERLLIEIILQKPFEFLKKLSLEWNGKPIILWNGKKIAFSSKRTEKDQCR